MPLRVALLAVGAVLGLWAQMVARASSGLSLATRTSWGTTFLLVVGWSAMVAAVVVLNKRHRGALLLYGIAIWWFVSELGSPAVGVSLAFTAGLVSSAVGPALVAHLVLSHPSGRLKSWLYVVVVVSGYVLTLGVMGIAATAVFDPGPMGCASCPNNLLLIKGDPSVFDRVNLIGAQLEALWSIVAGLAVVWWILSARARARTKVGLIGLAGTVFLGANAVQYLSTLSRTASDSSDHSLAVWGLQSGGILLLAVAVCAELWRANRARRNLTRLVVELRGTSPGGLREALARRLDDPELLIAYPIDGGRRHVDAEAREVRLDLTGGRRATCLVRGGDELATLVHRAGVLEQPQEAEDLVVSLQLAFESERLAAEDLTQLAEIQASGARIVDAGDRERRKVERDLHDGAQQRLVALLLNLRLIQIDYPDSRPALVEAEAELRHTIADLRRIAHGVYPVLLRDAGLGAALSALAETRSLTLEEAFDERYPDVIESTVYLLVSHLSDAGPTRLQIVRSACQLSVEATVDGQPRSDANLYDRIHTLGGRLDLVASGTNTRATLVLPLDGHAVGNDVRAR